MPYRLDLRDEAGRPLKASLLGMPKESDWILYPAYTDKTMIRDVLAYQLWREMGHYAPRCRYVEVFIRSLGGETAKAQDNVNDAARMTNGQGPMTKEIPGGKAAIPNRQSPIQQRLLTLAVTSSIPTLNAQLSTLNPSDYAGVYVLMEKIKRGKNRVKIARLDPEDANEPEVTGGYIVKKDRVNEGEHGFRTRRGMFFAYEEPKERDLTAAQERWLTNYLQEVENVLFSDDFNDPTKGYTKYLDVDSFIDFHWMVELSKNIDGYWFSQFYHKDRGGKLAMGPLWDWDLSFGNCFYEFGFKTNGWRWEHIRSPHYDWYERLFEDPDFLQRYIDRWSELRTNILATSNVLARIDRHAAELSEAQVRNYQRWPTLGRYVHPNKFIGRTYEEEVDWLKRWVAGRLAWIDSQGYPEPVGQITGGAPEQLRLTAEDGRIFFTLDGSDPRLPGTGVSPRALEYREPISLTAGLIVTARARSAHGLWSAPTVVRR